MSSARTEHIQLSLCWSGSPKGGGQKICSTTGHGVEEGTLGTYPAQGYGKALARPGAKSRYEEATERACRSPTLLREEIGRRNLVFNVRWRSEISSIGSKGSLQRAFSTTARSQARFPSGATPTVSTTLGGGEGSCPPPVRGDPSCQEGISHGELSRREIRSEDYTLPGQNGATSNRRTPSFYRHHSTDHGQGGHSWPLPNRWGTRPSWQWVTGLLLLSWLMKGLTWSEQGTYVPASWSNPTPRPDKWSSVMEKAHFSWRLDLTPILLYEREWHLDVEPPSALNELKSNNCQYNWVCGCPGVNTLCESTGWEC